MCPTGHPLPLGLHDSARPGLPRPPAISNPPPLISSTKHPSVLERQMSAISQVRWEGQHPRSIRVAWCPENSPFLVGCRLSICKVEALETMVPRWGLGTPGAGVVPVPFAAGVGPRQSGSWDSGGQEHGLRNQALWPWPDYLNLPCLGFPSVEWKVECTRRTAHGEPSVTICPFTSPPYPPVR